jgi:hypothetical protein
MGKLEDLRREAEIKRKRATAKVSRLRSKGVEIPKSNFDPRRAPKIENRYTEKQLRSYISELDSFNSRKTQFVPGLYGNPIPAEKWNQYKRLETAVNITARKRMEKFADVVLPGQETTIAQRDAILAARRVGSPLMSGREGSRPVNEYTRNNQTIKDVNAIDKLIMNAGRKLEGKNIKRILNSQRKAMSKMMINVGVPDDIQEMANGLNDEQFDLLWNYTPYPNALSITYGIKNNGAMGISAVAANTITEDSMSEVSDYVRWASKYGKKR